jgi:peptidoglycan/LPS O-acetylase OafA/YrhL
MAVFLVALPLLYNAGPDAKYAFLTPYPVGYMKLACNPIVFEFLMGIVAGAIFASGFRIESAALCYALVLITIVAAVASVCYLPDVRPDIGVAFFAVIVVCAICSKTVDLNCGRILTRLGDVSYTLYLVHWPISGVWLKFVVPVATPLTGVIAFTSLVLCSWGAALVLSPLLERKLPSALAAAMTTTPARFGHVRQRRSPMHAVAHTSGARPLQPVSRGRPPGHP